MQAQKGPAEASGLRVDDVIIQIDGAYVAHLAHWQVLKQLSRARSFWMVVGRAPLSGLRDEHTTPQVESKAVEGFLCPVCQMNLGSADALTDHFEQVHPPTPQQPDNLAAGTATPTTRGAAGSSAANTGAGNELGGGQTLNDFAESVDKRL